MRRTFPVWLAACVLVAASCKCSGGESLKDKKAGDVRGGTANKPRVGDAGRRSDSGGEPAHGVIHECDGRSDLGRSCTVVMGGGVGLGCHAGTRVVCETSQIAMPVKTTTQTRPRNTTVP